VRSRDSVAVTAAAPEAIVHNRGVHARFYAPAAQSTGDLVDLPTEEAEHLTRVLRLTAGAEVRVFNGRGLEFDAIVGPASRSTVQVRLVAARTSPAERDVGITLAQAVLKGDKMDDVVRDAVMLGVTAVQPMVTLRSEVTLQTIARGHRQERWERIAISSAKQCGRATIPAIQAAASLSDIAGAIGQMALPTPAFMFIEPDASVESRSLADIPAAAPREATILIGPEGGWSPAEIDEASRACQLITLAGPTLRADAMPLVALTALLTHWKQL
jgi:16S rRNA (uracil1498-N3)-methyltransferase